MKKTIPSTQALICFESAARHGSYTRAAQELALTQSAVSRQIIALETLLGAQLFRRAHHGVELTSAGKSYAHQVAKRLHGLEQDALDIMAHQAGAGSLSLAAMPTFATHWLVPRLSQLMAQQPQLQIHIETRLRPFLFAETEFDAALYCGTAAQVKNWPGVKATLLLKEDILPVCSPGMLPGKQPVSAEELATMPLLQLNTRPFMWRNWFDAAGVSAPRALSGSRYELISMLAYGAAHGLGVALVPPLLIQDKLARGELVPACTLPAIPSQRNYYLVAPANHGNPLFKGFAAWLLTQAWKS